MRNRVLENVIGWGISAVLLILAGLFFWAPIQVSDPVPEVVNVDRARLGARPIRVAMHDPPAIGVATFEMKCMECHALFENDKMMPAGLGRHDDIVMDHGINTYCFSCHDVAHRDRLAMEGGKTVGYDQVPQLCGKCHGPTWRDWQQGIHGKTIGSWRGGDERQHRYTCTDCHDPHTPAFKAGIPLPGPNTIRMTPGDGEHHDDGIHRPLAQWINHFGGNGHHDDGHHEEGQHQ